MVELAVKVALIQKCTVISSSIIQYPEPKKDSSKMHPSSLLEVATITIMYIGV